MIRGIGGPNNASEVSETRSGSRSPNASVLPDKMNEKCEICG
jgi:hypothetical protein